MKTVIRKGLYGLVAASALSMSWIGTASAHCDAMDGPVITEAKIALDQRDVTPLLKWVPEADEQRIVAAFETALRVRGLGDEARELADRHLFATLVEVHRASEGAPFTGIKPAGEIDPAIMAADAALESGDIDALVAKITGKFAERVRDQFAAAAQARKLASNSVNEGRDFVADYVSFIHYVEGVHGAVAAATGHDLAGPAATADAHAH